MEHSDRDQELREFLDNRENRIALAWMAIEGRESSSKSNRKIKRPVLWVVLFLAYVAFLLYFFLN